MANENYNEILRSLWKTAAVRSLTPFPATMRF